MLPFDLNKRQYLLFCILVLLRFHLLDTQNIRFPEDNDNNRQPNRNNGSGGGFSDVSGNNFGNTGNGNNYDGNRGTGNSGSGMNRPPNNNNFNTNWYNNPNCFSYRNSARRFRDGYCIPQNQCNELRYSQDWGILRASLCGFYGNEPKLCCPAQMNPNANNPYNPNNPNVYQPSSTPSPTPQPNNQPNLDEPDFTYPRSLPQTCGISPKESTRVVGGTVALPGAWPWMTSLQYGKSGSRSHLCGAALISHNLVVTASHCLKNDDDTITSANMLGVRLGEHNIEEDTADDAPQEFDVEQVVTHPSYNKDYKYDIAVLKLKGSVQFNERISPVCLPYDSEMIRKASLTNKKAFITGWGATSYGGSTSPVLLQASLKVVNPNFCKEAFKKWLTITDEYLCATSEKFDKDSCQGDSGGPLVMWDPNKKRYYLIGVVSFGKKCASKDTPGVYTRVGFSKTLAWLQQFF